MNQYYYKDKLPSVRDIVVVQIKSISNGGCYCNLIEYNNAEGLILATEISKRYVDPKKIFSENTYYPTMVIGVNSEKNTIDLSYIKIKADEREKILHEFKYKEKLKKLCNDMAEIADLPISIVLEETFWKFVCNNKITKSYEDFYNAVLEEPTLLTHNFPQNYQTKSDLFITSMKSRTVSTNMSLKQDFDMVVYDMDAINKINYILTHDIDENNSSCEINYITAPKYEIVVSLSSEQECRNKITTIVKKIKENIGKIYCKFQMSGDVVITKHKICTLKPLHHL